VFATELHGKVFDHITLKIQLLSTTSSSSSNIQHEDDSLSSIKYKLIEEECRAIILRLSMLDVLIKKPAEG